MFVWQEVMIDFILMHQRSANTVSDQRECLLVITELIYFVPVFTQTKNSLMYKVTVAKSLKAFLCECMYVYNNSVITVLSPVNF